MISKLNAIFCYKILREHDLLMNMYAYKTNYPHQRTKKTQTCESIQSSNQIF